MMKHIFIVNSISGKGKALKSVDTIKEVCEELKLDYDIRLTEYAGHTTEIAREYKPSDNVILYAVGGDGTLLDVVNGMDHNIELGAIPGGSGEDFLRYFHLDCSNLKQYIIDTINAKPINVDVGQTDRMRFLNTTSFGIDASINAEASRMIRKTIITKGPAYILSIIKNAFELKATKSRIVVDDKMYESNFIVVSCMNGKYYGNGVCAAPNSDLTDGYFDLILIEKIKGLKMYKILINYLTGNGHKSPEINVVHAKHIVVDAKESIDIQSDGENYESNHLEIKMLEGYLKLKIPASK